MKIGMQENGNGNEDCIDVVWLTQYKQCKIVSFKRICSSKLENIKDVSFNINRWNDIWKKRTK